MVSVRASFLVVAATGLTLSALAGCGGQGESGKKTKLFHTALAIESPAALKLAFVTNNASEFWKIADKGVEKAAKELNLAVTVKKPPAGKVEEQKKILEDLVSQGFHGVAVSVISAEDEVLDINKACSKTNVITHDSDAPKSNRLVYIGTNNYEAGRALGQEIAKLLPGGGKMAVFVGTLAADNAQLRLKGVADVVAPGGVEIIAKKEDNKDQRLARANVEDVINAYPEIDLLCGLWSYNGPAIVAAVKAAGKEGKIKVVAFDEEDGTLDGIEQGIITSTCVQKPFEFGYRSVKLLHDLALRGREAMPPDEVIDTGVEIIHSGNVADFKRRLAELKS
jgi:ribose transport system substrate-binding protein